MVLSANKVTERFDSTMVKLSQDKQATIYNRLEVGINDLRNFLIYYLRTKKDKTKKEPKSTILKKSMDFLRIAQMDVERLKNMDGVQDRVAENMKKLQTYVQQTIHDLQNPANCTAAPKLRCPLRNKYGLASGVHILLWCLLEALRKGRTLVVDTSKWHYAPKNKWVKTFLPILGPSCADADTRSTKKNPIPAAGRVRRDIVEIPSAIAEPLVANHGSPYAWWYGQLMRYILRLQATTLKRISDFKMSRGYKHPIVGVHIRRKDKIYVEAARHDVQEYMVHVEDYYAKLSLTTHVETKRVFVATDEPSVVDEIRKKYPQYKVINNEVASLQASTRNTSRNNSALFGVMLDITLLAESDFVVCTLSSGFCRVAYELMQTRHPDASLRVTSLDVEYFYAYNSFPPMKALYGNRPASARELGWPGAGVLIKRPGAGWAIATALFKRYNDGFNPGRLLSASKRSKSKQYPRFKTTQTYFVTNFKAFTAPLR
ncbi:alpha-(1,6)-fucosyltransferase-like [Ixodes scapularis]|uniref:alpha-(1,6)-fucosyltransferase-like n=1 Tax=Ixodes scapularis TaxID=6945 RepID=UPI001C39485C|nr:alpha-(1,6)-fucosyltransferase-like [Ixodes scapularis]